MTTVSKRELNQHTATTLNKVTDGNDVVVTEHGKPRWRVTAFREQESTLDHLRREGRYTPPSSSPPPWPESPGGRTYTSTEVDTLLDEMKGDH